MSKHQSRSQRTASHARHAAAVRSEAITAACRRYSAACSAMDDAGRATDPVARESDGHVGDPTDVEIEAALSAAAEMHAAWDALYTLTGGLDGARRALGYD